MHRLYYLLVLYLFSAPALASPRTFVSTTGTDSGVCNALAPCRTIAYALTQVDAGGDVVITNSGGYGSSISITQSVNITAAPGVTAILVPNGGDGIDISGSGINVSIKGLTINNQNGPSGIYMPDGASLNLQDVTISNFPNYGLIVWAPAVVNVNNATFLNDNFGMSFGLGAQAIVANSRVTGISSGAGIVIEGGSGNGGTTSVTVTDTHVTCLSTAAGYGFQNPAPTGEVGQMLLTRVSATNCQVGVWNDPADSTGMISLGSSSFTGNLYGILNSNGTFYSTGTNQIVGNSSDTGGTITTGGVH